MNEQQLNYVQKISEQYQEKQPNSLDELTKAHKKVKRPAQIFAYVFGSISSLILGTGMCFAMKVIGDIMAVGIVIGILGIALVCSTYPIYKKILQRRKAKYSKQILQLSNQLLNK